MPLCAGTGTAALYAQEKRMLGIDAVETPQQAWRMGAELLAKKEFSEQKNERGGAVAIADIVSEFAKKDKPKSVCFHDLLSFFWNRSHGKKQEITRRFT